MAAHRASWIFVHAATVAFLAVASTRAEPVDLAALGLPPMAALHEDARTVTLAEELLVNVDSTVRLVVPDKCELAGEIELKALAASAGLEEAYAFLPSLCLWIEVGHHETKTRTLVDTDVLERLAAQFSSVVLYHTHTRSVLEPTGYFPAYTDLITTILLWPEGARLLKNPITQRAATPLGVFEYEFVPSEETYRLIEKLKRTGLGDHIVQNLAFIYATQRHRERYYSAVRDCRQMVDDDPDRLAECFPMVLDNFVLRYRSIEEVCD